MRASDTESLTESMAVAGLLNLLSDQDPEVREAAEEVIAEIEAAESGSHPKPLVGSGDLVADAGLASGPGSAPMDPAGGPLLAELRMRLADANEDSRRAAAEDLGRLGPRAVPALPDLVARLADVDVDVRRAAVEAIGALDNAADRVAPQLVEALSDREAEVSRAAALALGRVSPSMMAGLQADLRSALKEGRPRGIFLPFAQRRELDLYLALGPAAQPFTAQTVRLLGAGHWSVRQSAARVLGAVRQVPDEAVQTLLQVWRADVYPVVRQAAGDALEAILSQDPDLPEEEGV